MNDTERDLAAWKTHRSQLVSLAYRMLGDLGRAEDLVQETWLRWSERTEREVRDPRAYLVTIVTRLCLNELSSAASRREHRDVELPEPIESNGALDEIEAAERISMALLVALHKLTPAERAVLLLHEVLELGHREIAAVVGKTEAGCRKLLERAHASLARDRDLFTASVEEHSALLQAFVQAAFEGDGEKLIALLADDAIMITDGGPDGRRVEGVRSLDAPLVGAERIAAFVGAVTKRGGRALTPSIREVNGRPALVLHRDGRPFGALLLAVAHGRIHRVYFHADPARLGHLSGEGRERQD
jgi:RNA polymerase sigma-70 factor, ECF subfamily